jgi:hypothetical protein
LTRAIQRESVLNLAKNIGYTATLAVPSTVSVLISIPITKFTSSDVVNMRMIGRNDIPTSTDENLRNQVYKVYAGNIPFSLKDTINIRIEKGNPIVNKQVVVNDDNGNNISVDGRQ